jgi:hypothetical protein
VPFKHARTSEPPLVQGVLNRKDSMKKHRPHGARREP